MFVFVFVWAGWFACSAEPTSEDTGDGVAFCPVPSMPEQFPMLPNPNGDFSAADACVSMAHDVIVVLGCPNNADGTASDCQRKRVDIALGLRAGGFGDTFITSGGAVYNPWVEADTLAQLLIEGGIADSAVFTDPLAEHTDENLYHASRIMEEQGFGSALVVSDQPEHLVFAATSDANCCVQLGRLSLFEFPVGSGTELVGHYTLFPQAEPVTDAECDHIAGLFMSTNLASRRACAEDFQL